MQQDSTSAAEHARLPNAALSPTTAASSTHDGGSGGLVVMEQVAACRHQCNRWACCCRCCIPGPAPASFIAPQVEPLPSPGHLHHPKRGRNRPLCKPCAAVQRAEGHGRLWDEAHCHAWASPSSTRSALLRAAISNTSSNERNESSLRTSSFSHTPWRGGNGGTWGDTAAPAAVALLAGRQAGHGCHTQQLHDGCRTSGAHAAPSPGGCPC